MTFPVGAPGARRPEHLLNRRRSTGGETPRSRPLLRPATPGGRDRGPRFAPVQDRPNSQAPAEGVREEGCRREGSPPWSGSIVATDSCFPRRGAYSPAVLLGTHLQSGPAPGKGSG